MIRHELVNRFSHRHAPQGFFPTLRTKALADDL